MNKNYSYQTDLHQRPSVSRKMPTFLPKEKRKPLIPQAIFLIKKGSYSTSAISSPIIHGRSCQAASKSKEMKWEQQEMDWSNSIAIYKTQQTLAAIYVINYARIPNWSEEARRSIQKIYFSKAEWCT